MALAAVFMIWIWSVGDEALETDASVADKIMDPNLILTYVSLIVTVALAIVLPAIGMLRTPKQAIRALIIVAAMAILGFITYGMATNTYDVQMLEQLKTTAETSRLVGAGLYFTYIMGALTVIATIISGVSGALKKV